MTNTDSPFIILPPSASTSANHQRTPSNAKPTAHDRYKGSSLGASFGTVVGDGKVEGSLYWNHHAVSSSLVCGSSNKEVLRTVMQMVRLHLNDARNSSALIFHANTRDHILPPSQVTTLQIAKRLSTPTVFLAPRPRQNIQTRYTDIPLPSPDVLPLRIAEQDISLAHVLALCTPPESYPGREGILVKVQGLVGRLREPFSIQEFNQFVDEEQWDEHGASFMAIRQTLLTTLTLIGGGGDISLASKENIDIASRMKLDGPIIVDLSDPVLRSTGMDATLFDMILCLYCMVKPDARKLLVLDQAPEYLTPSSPILNTLVTLLSMRADSPLRTLLSTSDVSQLSPRLMNHLDTYILHECRSPAWLSHIQQHVACPIHSQTVYGLESRQALVISPRSTSELRGQERDHSHGTKWGTQTMKVEIGWEWPLSIEQQKIEQLQALVAQLSHNTPHLPSHPSGNPQRLTSTNLQAIGTSTALGSTYRRSRKESTYVETTMNALRGALGYLATRRTADLSTESSQDSSPALPTTVPAPASAITATAAGTQSGTHTRTPTMTGTVVDGQGGEGGGLSMEKKDMASVILEESSGQESDRKKSSGPESVWPKSSAGVESQSEWVKSSGQESEWMKRPVSPEMKFTAPPRIRDLQDLGPFTVGDTKPLILPRRQSLAQLSSPSSPWDRSPPNPYDATSAPYDKTKLAEAIYQAISNAGGELGMPVSSQKVGDAFRRSAPPDAFRVPYSPPIEMYRMSDPPPQGRESWRMSIPHVPGAWRMSMPPQPYGGPFGSAGFGKAADSGFSTWKEITSFAEKEGIVKVVSNGQEEWIVMPKPDKTTGLIEGVEESGAPVQTSDGWYDRKDEKAFPALLEKSLIKTNIDASVYEPLIQIITELRAQQTFIQSPVLLVSVSYELKRRFPTAIRDAGFKTVLEYIHGAQARGLVEITDDSNGSIYVTLVEPVLTENVAPTLAAPRPPVSDISASTDKSQPESSAMPSSEVHVPYPRDKFEPLLAVLRSLKRHNLYKVTLVPLSLAIEKMFPNAMARFGVDGIEAYVTQARDAGLVTTGNTASGNLWVTLVEADTQGSNTPTQTRGYRALSMASASDLPFPPINRAPNYSRLLRAIRALSTQTHGTERVLCSRVGMMLNKDDYKAMNVETFAQALVAASKANLVVHGGVAGSAWVALKMPDVAGVTSAKHRMEEPRARLVKSSPPEIATNPVVPSGSAYKLPLTEADVEPFRPLIHVLRTFIHTKHIAEPFRTVVEKNLLKAKSDVLMSSNCLTMDDYILRAQSYGLIAQVGNGKASRLRLLENSGLSIF